MSVINYHSSLHKFPEERRSLAYIINTDVNYYNPMQLISHFAFPNLRESKCSK